VGKLILEATSHLNLCQCYVGWYVKCRVAARLVRVAARLVRVAARLVRVCWLNVGF
jgi:hypothetical protein